MQELIEIWLRDKNYELGVELYRRFGGNEFLKSMFAEADDDYNREKLTDELYALLKTEDNQEPTAKVVEQILSDELKPLSDASDAPKEVRDTIKRRKYLYAVGREAFAKMKLAAKFGKQDAAAEFAFQILDGFDEIQPLWNYTNFYNKTGRVMVKVEEMETDFEGVGIVELNKKWLTNYKYVSKYKSDFAKHEKLEQRISENVKIKKTLTSKDAFQHAGLEMPAIAVAGSGEENEGKEGKNDQ